MGGYNLVNVNASAMDLGLRYFFGGDIAPTLYAEYGYGSGDGDRVKNVTSSKEGSTAGDDKAYRAFGGLPMGNALAPGLANIKIYKWGGSFKPFGRSPNDFWSDMTWQGAYYSYSTAVKGGATSDNPLQVGAAAKSQKIGNEMDLNVSWKILSDASYQLKLGQFKPGAAYGPSRAKQNYIKMKWTFDL